MPVSKNKRRKTQGQQSAREPFRLPLGLDEWLGDKMAKELDSEAAIVELRAAGKGFTPEQLGKAQEFVFDAWEASDRRTQLPMAAKALQLCPWCGDAYGLLAMAAPQNSDIAIHFWRMAVAAAEFALKAEMGDDVFERYAGEFWGVFETRPYMRARVGLSNALWGFGEREAAVELDLQTLRLNPNDNQGARYVAACRLLALGRDSDLETLLGEYSEDSTFFLFTRAAWSFRREGDSAQSRQLLRDAIGANSFVPVYLLGRKRPPEEGPGFYGLGDENEAVVYLEMAAEAWRAIPGALMWLSKHARLRKPSTH